MSKPRPRQIWEVIYSDVNTQEVFTKPVLVLSPPSVQQNIIITPLLSQPPEETTHMTLNPSCFITTLPSCNCYISPYHLYPVNINLFIRQVGEITTESYLPVIEGIAQLMKSF